MNALGARRRTSTTAAGQVLFVGTCLSLAFRLTAAPLEDAPARRHLLAARRALHLDRHLEAGEAFELACDLGAGEGCAGLAALYRSSEVFPRDDATSTKLLRRACAFGEASSCRLIGNHVLEEDGPGDALDWFRQACELGDTYGCHNQAMALLQGQGTAGDAVRALGLLERECLRANGRSCLVAGGVVLRGLASQGTDAAHWFSRACELGEPDGCALMAQPLPMRPEGGASCSPPAEVHWGPEAPGFLLRFPRRTGPASR